jgi:hypothetical protein
MITTTRVPITSRITIAAVIEVKQLLQPDHANPAALHPPAPICCSATARRHQ